MDDVLLTALARSLTRRTGSPAALVHLERHGREPLFDDMDLSRTVGWFTALVPLRLDLAGSRSAAEALRLVKEQVRRLPGGGLGFGLLSRLGRPETRARMARLPQPAIGLNYLGQVRPEGDGSMRAAPESAGPAQDPDGVRPHPLEIGARVTGGRLTVEWSFGRERHHRSTVESLADDFQDELRALIAECTAPGAVGYTPSDFPDAELDESDLASLLEELGGADG